MLRRYGKIALVTVALGFSAAAGAAGAAAFFGYLNRVGTSVNGACLPEEDDMSRKKALKAKHPAHVLQFVQLQSSSRPNISWEAEAKANAEDGDEDLVYTLFHYLGGIKWE